jgi:putative flippase GtrA
MRGLLDHLAEFRRSKHARFCVVSFNGVVITQIMLLLFVHALGRSAVVANLIAVSLSCIPSFVLNRYWVWGHGGRRNLGPQIVAFWAMALVGLAVSTLVVSWLDQVWDSPVVANVGNMIGFGGLWVAKFLVLDRVMFRHGPLIGPLVGPLVGSVDLPVVDPVAVAPSPAPAVPAP